MGEGRASITLTPKLSSPLRIPLQILTADRRPSALDRLDEVPQPQGRFEQILRLNVNPRHLDRAFIAR